MLKLILNPFRILIISICVFSVLAVTVLSLTNDSSTSAAITSSIYGTASAIQDAIDDLNGAPGTIYIRAGEFNLGGIVTLHEGVEIIGAGADSTTINTTGDQQWLSIPDGADNCRISGIKFDYPAEGKGQAIYVGRHYSDTILDFRIDNCEFYGYGYNESAIKIRGDVRGVIDHNYFENTKNPYNNGFGYGVMYDGDNTYTTNTSKYLGTAENVFIEDNEFRYCRHSIAANRGAHYVFRYNWCHDGILGQQVDAHGGYNDYDYGTILADVYNNVIEDYVSGPDRAMKFRGGQFIVHDNYLADYNHFMMLQLENGATKEMALKCKIHDSYEWNNKGLTDVYVDDGDWSGTDYIRKGVEYFTDTRHPTYKPYTYPHPLTQEGSAPINSSPVASNDSYSTYQDMGLTIGNPGVLSNDNDPEGDKLSAVFTSSTSHGLLILNADGSFNYTPDSGFSGTDSFSYKASDGTNSSNSATVKITVVSNENPLVKDTFGLDSGNLTFEQPGNSLQVMRFMNTAIGGNLDSLSILFDDTTPSGKVRLGVYADDSGAPGALLLDAGEATVQDGWVSITGLNLPVEQDVYYWLAYILQEPNGVRYQSDQLADSHYWVNPYEYGAMPGQFASGSNPNSNQFVLRATISNNYPIAGDDAYITEQSSELIIGNSGVLSNDSNSEGDALSAVLVSSVSHGSLILHADGSFTYTPASDFSGTDSFHYKASNGISSSNTAIVTINVSPMNMFDTIYTVVTDLAQLS